MVSLSDLTISWDDFLDDRPSTREEDREVEALIAEFRALPESAYAAAG
ncbi:hypothetical protein MUG78_17255 [Gordonia alkaliphila]|nr:hypothetical protein [Gordonia alkaliphila]MCK0441149.1 hypothetical protein [Gordonia alkaliphila]